MTVTIVDEKHQRFGELVNVEMVYYDHAHTGDSADMIFYEKDGKHGKVLSTQVDQSDYERQLSNANF